MMSWTNKKFGDCAELIRETIIPHLAMDLNYIGLEHISQGGLSLVGIGKSSEVVSQKSQFRRGDILYGKLRPYFRKLIIAPFDGVCSTDIWVVRAKPGIDQRFLFYWMATQEFVDQSSKASEGTKMPRAIWEFVSRFEKEIPPLAEQRAIAEVLSSLDDKIELNRRMNRTLEQLAQAIYKHMFVDNPERVGWESHKLGEIANVNWGDTNTTKASYVSNGYLAYSAKGPDGYLPYYDFDNTGVVVSAIGANSGMTWLAQGKWSCIKNTIRFWSTSEKVSTEYLFMATFGNEKWPLRGSAQPFISQTDARNLLIPVPEKGLAKKYGDIANPFFSQMDQNIKQNKVLAELRDTLLPKLMSGQVRVKSALHSN